MIESIIIFVRELENFYGDRRTCNDFLYAYLTGMSNYWLKRKLDWVLEDISKQPNSKNLIDATYCVLIEIQKLGD